MNPKHNSSTDKYTPAPHYKRLSAFIFQLVISIVPIFIIAYLLGYTFADFIENFALFALALIIIGMCSSLLGVILYPVYQGNVGHKLFNLKVVDAKTEHSIHSKSHGAFRGFLKVCMVPLIFPVLIIFLNKNRQTLWDKISNTKIVYVRKN